MYLLFWCFFNLSRSPTTNLIDFSQNFGQWLKRNLSGLHVNNTVENVDQLVIDLDHLIWLIMLINFILVSQFVSICWLLLFILNFNIIYSSIAVSSLFSLVFRFSVKMCSLFCLRMARFSLYLSLIRKLGQIWLCMLLPDSFSSIYRFEVSIWLHYANVYHT